MSRLHRRVVFIGLFMLLAGLAACEDALDPHSLTGLAERAIVNGTTNPQVVSLSSGQTLAIGWLYEDGNVSDSFCTGTLIAPDVVVTASHCTEDYRASEIGFAVGPRQRSAVASFEVAEILEHPRRDAALLILDEEATLRVDDLEPLTVNTDNVSNEDVGRPLDAAGYGDTYDTNPEGRWFARVYLDLVGTDSIIVDGRGQQGICYGDSGGPVLWDRGDGTIVVVAVESQGDSSCVDRDTLTRLDAIYEDFIEPIIGSAAITHGCGGLDYLGRCDGDVAEWCDGGEIQSHDCASGGGGCGWVDAETGYYCVERVEAPEPEPQPVVEEPTPSQPSPSTPSPETTPEQPATGGSAAPPAAEPANSRPGGQANDDLAGNDGSSEPAGSEALGCAQAGTGPSTDLALLALLGWVGLRRRRSATLD